MAAVDWMVLCESAFFDENGRLCLIGIARHFPVPSIPLLLFQHTLVAHLADPVQRKNLAVSFAVRTPSAVWVTPDETEAARVTRVEDYILVTLRNLPLKEEGLYRFGLSMNDEPAASLDIPVWIVPPRDGPLTLH